MARDEQNQGPSEDPVHGVGPGGRVNILFLALY